ncbi:MAG: ankyrin repeat domain-containing protein [cyanobacterium endosymbiont of Rhopalodia sterrenbergii]
MSLSLDFQLVNAARQGNLKDVKVLLVQDARVNATDFRQTNVLMYAAQRGDCPIVDHLLEKGLWLINKDLHQRSVP